MLPVQFSAKIGEGTNTCLGDRCSFIFLFLLDGYYILCLEAFGALLYREFNFLALFKGAEAITADSGEVYENIRSIFLRKETITFTTVEPFDGSDHSI